MSSETELAQAARQLAGWLLAQNATLATAESCTGGWIAKVLTDLPGSSAWFKGGIVSYSNAAKAEILGVSEAILAREGAVSEAVVKAMARGACTRLRATFGVAVSGVAGPDGGSEEKPVGTVWIAWAGVEGIRARRFWFAGDRGEVRRQTVREALLGVAAQ